jgi:hypothetical protein
MLDSGQYGSDFVRVPAETQQHADWQYFQIREEAQKGWLL